MTEHTAAIVRRHIAFQRNGYSADAAARTRFEQLFNEHAADLGRFLHQIVRDRCEAEDLLQETFVVAWREHDVLKEATSPRAWLFGVARNRALMSLRTGRRKARALARLSGRDLRRDDGSEAVAVRDFLVRHLDPDDRALVVLRYVHGFSAAELAEASGLSAAAVRQRTSRACRRVAEALDAAASTEPGRDSR
jgi:RNA polymerase sigma-70 factor (ECF subfamily)